jgi:hypothetical protein
LGRNILGSGVCAVKGRHSVLWRLDVTSHHMPNTVILIIVAARTFRYDAGHRKQRNLPA